MNVKNLANNQQVITTENAKYFVSYGTNIAKIENGKTFFDKEYWDFSRTTLKYLGQFLGYNKKEMDKKIKNGEVILVDNLK